MIMGIFAIAGFSILFIYRHLFIPFVRFLFSIINLRRTRQRVPPIGYDPILTLSAVELSNAVKSRKYRAVEVMETYIERIKAVNPIINAVVQDRFGEALSEAQKIDRRLDDNDSTLQDCVFVGVPFTVKVAFGVKGLINSAGLVLRKDIIAEEDAVLVTRMREQGGIPVCVSNVSELCMWWESSNPLHGTTCNPYDNRRIVGGSSGGEGSLLASGASVIGIGSDIGGSIRMPAFFNGVFGHKCTTGMIDNTGQFPNADGEAAEFMVSGPLVRYVDDLLPATRVMAGADHAAEMGLDCQVDVKNIKYYVLEDIDDPWFTSPVEEDIRKKLRQVVQYLRDSNYSVEELNLPLMKHAFQMWAAKMGTARQTRFCRLMGNLKYDVNPFLEILKKIVGLSNHTVAALLLACAEKFTLMADEQNQVLTAQCEELGNSLAKILGKQGCLLMPTHPTSALFHNEPLFVSPNFAYTGIVNVLGLPATAIPLGLDSKKGVPVGIQAISCKFNDYITLAVAKDIGLKFKGWVSP